MKQLSQKHYTSQSLSLQPIPNTGSSPIHVPISVTWMCPASLQCVVWIRHDRTVRRVFASSVHSTRGSPPLHRTGLFIRGSTLAKWYPQQPLGFRCWGTNKKTDPSNTKDRGEHFGSRPFHFRPLVVGGHFLGLDHVYWYAQKRNGLFPAKPSG